ncbi:MAG: creatinine amidohydrolase [Hyphomicrobiales bacterium]|jgi:creatinine amidohydrolase|nr:creatinine amidohydrolase [Hyphomicrobiales bacterium]
MPACAGMTAESFVTDWLSLTTEEFGGTRIAVLPVAAVEQHGPHLPVGVDTYIAEAYLARVRALLPDDSSIVFLPVQAVGASDEHRAFRGTLTLSPQTALRAFIEIGDSISRAGIRKLVIVNSHGGNIALIDLAARQLRVRHNMLAVHASWGRFGYPGPFTEAELTHGIHGGDIETSIMLAAYPELVRRDRIANFTPATIAMERDYKYLRADFPAGFGWMTQDLHASGAVGDASLATAEKGEAALQHGARSFVALLRDVEKFDLERLAAGPLG